MRHLTSRRGRLRRRALVLTTAVASLAAIGVASADVTGYDPFGSSQVGQKVNGAILLPSNQWISPLGRRALVKNARLVSSNLSPNGQDVAALSWNDFAGGLTIIDAKTGSILQQLGLGSSVTPSDPYIGDGTVAADGPFYSPDGSTLWVPQSSDLIRFAVNSDGTVVVPGTVVALPTNGPGGAALPSGMTFVPNSTTAYVALNGYNTLGVLDTGSNTLVKQIPVGDAPRQVILNGNEAYVSNEGGRPATGNEFTNLSDGTAIVSNRSTGAASTGTVSIVDLTAQKEVTEIPVGLQPTAMYLNNQDGALFVANSNDDSVSIINTNNGSVAQTVNINPVPGATESAATRTRSRCPTPNHVLISIGRDNAIADYQYNGLNGGLQSAGPDPDRLVSGAGAAGQALNKIVVTNDKGIGARGPCLVECPLDKGPDTSPAKKPVTGHNTYNDTGSVTTFNLPADSALPRTRRPCSPTTRGISCPPSTAARVTRCRTVIPPTIGDPSQSPIKHVFVLVKENRTYDQVLGDLGDGNGARSLAQFGEKVTPNLHALARSSVTSTISMTRARCRLTVTTGSCRRKPTTTSRRSSALSTAPIPPRAAMRSPTSGAGSSGTRRRRPA